MMLHASIGEAKKSMLSNFAPAPRRWSPEKKLPHEAMTTQSVYGNQAMLRMLSARSTGPQSVLQRKPDCACGGSCASCKHKSESFYGDLDDHIEKQMPGTELPGTPAPVPMDKSGGTTKKAAPSCTDICDRAYKDDSLNTGGGGVVCDGSTKCACAFDVPPLKRGQCPDFDQVVINHESKHVKENNSECDPKGGLHRAKVKDESKLVERECEHRKASIKEIDALLPKAEGDCKTGMKSIRDLLDTWVKATC
jgi:hypothetical protein